MLLGNGDVLLFIPIFIHISCLFVFMPCLSVAVGCGYDTWFAVKTCDGLSVIPCNSEIDHIHLGIEAQCATTLLPLGDCHTILFYLCTFRVLAKIWKSRQFRQIRPIFDNAGIFGNIFQQPRQFRQIQILPELPKYCWKCCLKKVMRCTK